ncbi:MAG: hypothetical protein NZM37_04570 [Sandaracinaceae bacterium]|nr:hypothetical protein [Sandaracinaceae bacterium]MDW8246577.1 hypothetical protein [Sandaracinaceae bacterium]
MEVAIIQESIFALPSSERVNVIVYDGSTELKLKSGPGPDRELAFAYGQEMLEQVLESERNRLKLPLPLGSVLRLHPGKLHCDFLLWLALRPPESKEGFELENKDIEEAVEAALEFVIPRNVSRIAFPPLGASAKSRSPGECMALVVQAANRFYSQRLAQGKPNPIEKVVVCDPRPGVIREAKRLLGNATKLIPTPAPALTEPAPSKQASGKSASKEGAKASARLAATSTKSTSTSKPASTKPALDPALVAQAKSNAKAWDRHHRYAVGEWMIHPKFGVGRVEEKSPRDDYIVVLFEDGETRRLIHGS